MAFSNCSNLTSIKVDLGNPKYDSRDNCNAIIETENNTLIMGCSNTIIPNSITSIGNYAFMQCSSLSSISIPNSVTAIGNGAFQRCTGLSSISIPNSLTTIGRNAFYECTGLSSISIPNSVINIGEGAFSGCKGLKSIVIPNSVDSIKASTFYSCTDLKTIELNNITFIGERAFGFCQNLTNIEIPVNVKTIEDGAFCGCNSLTSIKIPDNVTKIGNRSFGQCDNLTTINIPNSVTSIGEYAFFKCPKLTSIEIPSKIESIGEHAFSDCSSISSIIVNNKNKKYDSRNNCNAIIETSTNTLIVGCKNTNISEGITAIGQYAFYGCNNLKTIKIPNSVTTIGNLAFYECASLSYISLPNNLSQINDYTFHGCDSLTIIIPKSVTSIGTGAFTGNQYYVNKSIIFESDNPVEIDEWTFSSYTKIYVPFGRKELYRNTKGWNNYWNIVEYINSDVNIDQSIDVLDVVDIVRYVVGNPTEIFVDFLADINSDGTINIGDAVALVNVIAGDQNFARAMKAPRKVMSNDILTLTENHGELSFNLTNERKYTAFQFDLYIPEGTDIEKLMLNALRKQKHQLLYNKVEDGHYRVAALSTSNKVFNANDGELLHIIVSGTDGNEISIRDIHFFDVEGNDYRFADITINETTGIEKLTSTPSNSKDDVYDLQGHKMKTGSLTKGLYIVGGKKMMVK